MTDRIPIVVDNRLRMPLEQLGDDLLTAIKAAFTHDNPKHHKIRAMGHFPGKKEPATIATWREQAEVIGEGASLTLPRGGMQRLREVLAEHRQPWQTFDQRTEGDGPRGIPPHNVELWDHQRDVVEAMKRTESGVVHSPVGCLVGETIVGINRGGKGSSMPIEHVVKMFNGGTASGRVWDPNIPTMVRCSMDGYERLAPLAAAVCSGRKEVCRLETEHGHEVIATLDHLFMTTHGWKRLGDISIGDVVFVSNGKRGTATGTKRKKLHYKRVCVRHHPYARRQDKKVGDWIVARHRLVAEAVMNGIAFDEYVAELRKRPRPDWVYLDPEEHHVHHRDGDSLNNSSDNLEIMTVIEHHREHAAPEHVLRQVERSRVVAIERWGISQTFDLALADEPHNFLANGIVVHNSGKTTAALALAAELNLTTLIIVWSSSLLGQWIARIVKELGLSRSQIGIIQGKKQIIAPITLAMQQTLNKNFGPAVADKFGLVICDEVQRFAASTFMQTVDKFPARYRFGISDDSKRKDGKAFLIGDLFGGVLHEVDRAAIEDEGLVLPVELRVIPTAFTSERYETQRLQHYCAHDFGPDACAHCGLGRHERSQSPNFHHLLEDLISNPDRNKLIRSIVASEVEAGQQVLAFSHRVAHCQGLLMPLELDGLRPGLLIGGDCYADEFDRTKRGLLDGSIRAAVGTIQAVGQGMDVPGLSRGVLCTPITNNKQLLRQVTGRICRRADGKKDAAAYIIHDAVQSDETIKRYLRWYDRVMVHVGGDYATGEYVNAREWLKNRMQGRLEMTG